MRVIVRILVALTVLLVVVAAPVAAQEVVFSEEDAELAADFEAELTALLNEAGFGGAGEVPNILGWKGLYDLDPGTAVLEDVIMLLAASPLPDTGNSHLTGGCEGIALSFDEKGVLIDAAGDFDPAGPPIDLLESDLDPLGVKTVTQAFTEGNPFEVHVNGFVAYAGRATPAPINHTWQITTFGQAIDSGGDPNTGERNRNAGVVSLKDDLPGPAKINALFQIKGDMQVGGSPFCDGAGYFRTVGGSPILGGAGLVLVFLAGLGAFFNARPAKTWRG